MAASTSTSPHDRRLLDELRHSTAVYKTEWVLLLAVFAVAATIVVLLTLAWR